MIGIFLGIDLILGYRFLQEPNMKELTNQLKHTNLSLENPSLIKNTLDDQKIIALINQRRQEKGLEPFAAEALLNKSAQELLQVFEDNQYLLEQYHYRSDLKKILEDNQYLYQKVSNIAVLGPVTSQNVVEVWASGQQQDNIIFDKEFSQVGVAHQEANIEGQKVGLTVLIAAIPGSVSSSQAATPQAKEIVTSSASQVREVPDQEVVDALNQYRSTHGIHQLVIDQNLCQYAKERVSDLIAYGSLDNHQGFKEDFADLNNIPQSIANYSGGRIGENLASQFCINGTTQESFVANTGTALIEWCFDSSTSGHREAQLDSKYNAVCIRHGQNMYVVIFGE